MYFDFLLDDVRSLIQYIEKCKEKGYVGALNDISGSYMRLISRTKYVWYFCEDLKYSDLDDNVKGNSMEFDALLYRLKTLEYRLQSAMKYSHLHIDVAFEELEQIIIDEIEMAEHFIDIAVAWVTNDKICQALNAASKRGVLIRMIINDDDINKGIEKRLNSNIILYKAPNHGTFQKNKMHNKFCIFDSEKVITGSYNWTNTANYNNENIVIILNEQIAKSYRKQFNMLVISIDDNKL